MPELTHNIVYKITNLVNNKIYVGVHKTNNLEDGYMGSGIVMRQAIKKYGLNNFDKEILFDYETYQEALNKEKEIVNEEFLSRNDTYNLRRGGLGGFDYLNKQPEILFWRAKGGCVGGKKVAIRNRNLALEKYKRNPKYCKACGKEISFSRRTYQFCNRSCSAKYNNIKRRKIKYIIKISRLDIEKHLYEQHPKFCPCCGSIIPFSKRKSVVFCSKSCKTKQQHLRQPELRWAWK